MPVSDWDGPLAELDFEGININIPNAIVRLSKNLDPRNYDSSGIGPGMDVRYEMSLLNSSDAFSEEEEESSQSCLSHVRTVNYTSLSFFRRQLVIHFKILFERNKLIWPQSKR